MFSDSFTELKLFTYFDQLASIDSNNYLQARNKVEIVLLVDNYQRTILVVNKIVYQNWNISEQLVYIFEPNI